MGCALALEKKNVVAALSPRQLALWRPGLAQGASATQATQAASPRARRKCLWPGKNNQACYVIARLYTDRPGDRLRAKQARRLAIVRAEAHGSALL